MDITKIVSKYRSFKDVVAPTVDDRADRVTACCQWSSSDGVNFIPTAMTFETLTPGTYDIGMNEKNGVYFEHVPVVTTGLIRFPDTSSEKIISEIQRFWDRESSYREFGICYKRGILLYGPPGSGKSSTIRLVMQDVVDRSGIVINFKNPELFTAGIRKLREIQPSTPVVVLMEDIDAIMESNFESEVLNVLDGVNQVDKAVFLATTNYPEKLGDRVINRPSRFDKRFRIGHPNEESRRIYLEQTIGLQKIESLKINLDLWVKKTDGFSVAHLKELFVAVVILGDDFDEAVNTLKSMVDDSPSSRDDMPRMGF